MEGRDKPVELSCTVTLWHASGVEVPAKLFAALTGRGLRVTRVGDPFHALAELCRSTRGKRPPDTGTRLVIVFPELLTDAAELCTAAAAYAPAVPRWQYGPATNPTLRPIVDDDVTQWSSRRSQKPAVITVPEVVRPLSKAPTSRTKPDQPQLRLAGEGPEPEKLYPEEESTDSVEGARLAGEASASGNDQPSSSRSHLITDEELRMLLGEHNDEGRS